MVTPVSNTSLVNVTVGASVYPPPPDVTVMIPTTPSPIVVVAVAPLPVLFDVTLNLTAGATA